MPVPAWKHEERHRQKNTNVFTKTSGDCVIAVRNISFIDKQLPINYIKGLIANQSIMHQYIAPPNFNDMNCCISIFHD